MKKFTMFACLALALVFALSSFAGVDRIPSKGQGTVFGAGVNYAKAGGDTINLMAPTNDPTNGPGEPLYDGDFEDINGDPSWNGWTHKDLFAAEGTHWQVSDYNQDGGDNAAWCGSMEYEVCIGDPQVDVEGGYGHNYNDIIKFRSSVPYTDQNTTVTWAANVQYDSEDGWDYTYVTVKKNNATDLQLHELSAKGTLALNESVTYLPGDYIEDDQIFLQFRFQSDSNTDDDDCGWAGAGGVQVDDISVTIANGDYNMVFTEDFETITELVIDEFNDDMYKDMWVIGYSESVGDFTGLWTDLKDIDPCRSNSSTQIAFIDDGLVVDGTDGSACNTWCYGPGGWITNPTGGLLGGDNYFDNQAISPPMDWPDDNADGIIFTFTVYRHELLAPDSPGIFYYWMVRSADVDLGEDIESASWDGAPFIYYGGPNYHSNAGLDVTDKMVAGRDVVQVLVEAFDHPGVAGTDGSPAPYFDNVRVKVYPFIGPAMNNRFIDLAQSSFPTRGTIDTGDLASHSIRFDAAINISPDDDLRNDPGDSIAVNIVPVREDAEFYGVPSLHYTMQQNPVFNDYRTAGYPASGVEPGSPAVGSTGSVAIGVWAFDLPDSGFLFPGDILHYYIKAEDEVLGNSATRQTSLLPGDLTGYGDFAAPNAYNSSFIVRGLPTIVPDGDGYKQPSVLFVNDFGNRGGENEWYFAFNNLGLLSGEDYDIYHVNGPSSGVGNGIGGRATHLTLIGEKTAPGQDPELMTGYTEILYTAGDLGAYSIANGDFEEDPSKDVELFQNWLDFGGNDLFVTGDDVLSYLAGSAGESLVLAEDYFGVSVVSNDLGPLIGGQTTPLVKASASQPVFNVPTFQSWIAYGGCLSINTFDAVNPIGTGQRIADFTDAQGNVPNDPYSAAILNIITENVPLDSRVISLPYDFMYIHTDPASPANPISGRAQLLRDVLAYFGVTGNSGNVTAVLPGIAFQTSNYPNPFNPSTTINYSMPKAGHLSLNVYNVRGQLVKTLIDGNRPAGADQSIVWDGTNNQGSSVSSGVYFYEARTNGEVKVQKMALVK